ncbi:hypothetical protein H0X48_06230 [Candidatus Dependentiae bacterium]|nr:hypothetical protein [Candidatus Dependentiae bacterium]
MRKKLLPLISLVTLALWGNTVQSQDIAAPTAQESDVKMLRQVPAQKVTDELPASALLSPAQIKAAEAPQTDLDTEDSQDSAPAQTETTATPFGTLSAQMATPQARTLRRKSMADISKRPQKKLKQSATTRANKNMLNSTYLGSYLEPWIGLDDTETFIPNFENRQLKDFLKFLENALKITIILPDNLDPAPNNFVVEGTKISFESKFPLTRKQLWELAQTFLDMSGFALIPTSEKRTYRVVASTSATPGGPSANREPLPTFIGVDPDYLPNDDSKIRYVYFVENADLETIRSVIDTLKSSSSGPTITFPTLRAIIITDKSSNIKSLTQILQELDKVTMPETLEIIKLRRTDSVKVANLYNELIGKAGNAPQQPFNPFYGAARRTPTTQYFTPATRVFAEPRTNSLIVLGTRDNVKRLEEFIVKEIDKEATVPFAPLHIYQLKYIQSDSIADILTKVIQGFNGAPDNQAAAQYGGVRDGNKFFRNSVKITSEPSGNRLVINADYEEYLKLSEILEKIDVEQPQVALKVLILNVDLTNDKQLGTQLRSKVDCCDGSGGADAVLGRNVNFQTSGPVTGPIVQNPIAVTGTNQVVNGAQRLLGNLIQLAQGAATGSTLITLGQDMFGVWGIIKALEAFTRVSVIANPFLITNHKYKAEVSVGQTRRVLGSTVVSGNASGDGQVDIAANLTVSITPQISYDDMITLDIYVSLEQFTSTDVTNGNRLIRRISTEALVADKEVLALGGFIQDQVLENETKVPLLGDIPLIGWLFKQKTKTISRTSLLILISPEIIRPHEPEVARSFTQHKINDAKELLYEMRKPYERRDPLHRFIFRDHQDKEASKIDKFSSTQQRYIDESQKKIVPVLAYKTPEKKSLLDLVKPDPALPTAGVAA